MEEVYKRTIGNLNIAYGKSFIVTGQWAANLPPYRLYLKTITGVGGFSVGVTEVPPEDLQEVFDPMLTDEEFLEKFRTHFAAHIKRNQALKIASHIALAAGMTKEAAEFEEEIKTSNANAPGREDILRDLKDDMEDDLEDNMEDEMEDDFKDYDRTIGDLVIAYRKNVFDIPEWNYPCRLSLKKIGGGFDTGVNKVPDEKLQEVFDPMLTDEDFLEKFCTHFAAHFEGDRALHIASYIARVTGMPEKVAEIEEEIKTRIVASRREDVLLDEAEKLDMEPPLTRPRK